MDYLQIANYTNEKNWIIYCYLRNPNHVNKLNIEGILQKLGTIWFGNLVRILNWNINFIALKLNWCVFV